MYTICIARTRHYSYCGRWATVVHSGVRYELTKQDQQSTRYLVRRVQRVNCIRTSKEHALQWRWQRTDMPFSEDDKALMKNLHLYEGYGSRGLLAEFSVKNWMKGRLDTLPKKLKKNGSTDWERGSSRPKMEHMFAPELANNWNMTVSQGSAAMPLRRGGICNDHFVANFVVSLAVKEFWKLVNISWSYRHK